MAEKKSSEEIKKEAEEKADLRELELKVLGSESLTNLVIAGAGKNTEFYGKIGKEATVSNYLAGLSNADEHVAKILGMPYMQSALNAQKNGQDIYEEGISTTPAKLLKIAQGVYRSGFDKVKVSDVLDMLGYKEIHPENISEGEKGMYMEDFKEKNKEMYNTLITKYIGSVQNQGVAKAISEYDLQDSKELEEMLKEAPKKEEPKDKKSKGNNSKK